jgi:hypothetical protein
VVKLQQDRSQGVGYQGEGVAEGRESLYDSWVGILPKVYIAPVTRGSLTTACSCVMSCLNPA